MPMYVLPNSACLFRRLNCEEPGAKIVSSIQAIVFCQLVRNTVRASLNSYNEVATFEV